MSQDLSIFDQLQELSLNDHSTFDNPRPISSSVIQIEKASNQRYDFLTFLAVAQCLEIDYLPIAWQESPSLIGSGGTSRISQAWISSQTSFAFKLVADSQKCDSRIFEVLISEIIVLRHPSIRTHPNIVELQGVCWDVPSKSRASHPPTISSSVDNVWPVLVFEKSQFGDLYHFATRSVGKGFGFDERLKLCFDIGTAIADMHSYQIIHGDIKPHNVLVFQDKNGDFTAKVTDFGYSTCYFQKDDMIRLPKSKPWYAPEYKDSDVKSAEAHAMDIFSFGMLFFWLIFERFLSGSEPLPAEIQWAHLPLQHGQDNHLWNILEELKHDDSLVLLAHQLLMIHGGLQPEQREALKDLFSMSLVSDPKLRTDDVDHLLKRLDPNWIMRGPSLEEFDLVPIDTFEFEILHSLRSLYAFDYRVRIYIVKCMEEQISSFPSSPLTLQLAICFKIGFGCTRNDEYAHHLLQQSGATEDDVEKILIQMTYRGGFETGGTIYEDLLNNSYALARNAYDYYEQHDQVEEARSAIRQDMKALEIVLGSENELVMSVKSTLSTLLKGRLGWMEVEESEEILLQESEELTKQVLESSRNAFGKEDLYTLSAMRTLATAFVDRGQKKQKEAERLLAESVDISKRMLGEEHLDTLLDMGELAEVQYTLYYYDRQEKAEETSRLEMELVHLCEKKLEEESPDAILITHILASVYERLDDLEKAKNMWVLMIEMSKKRYGDEHRNTLACMGYLVGTLERQRNYKEAENLEVKLIEIKTRLFGERHRATLSSVGSLSVILFLQGPSRHEEAGRLHRRVMELSEGKFDEDAEADMDYDEDYDGVFNDCGEYHYGATDDDSQ